MHVCVCVSGKSGPPQCSRYDYLPVGMCMYIYIYIYVCMCVCVYRGNQARCKVADVTIYLYVCMCVCM